MTPLQRLGFVRSWPKRLIGVARLSRHRYWPGDLYKTLSRMSRCLRTQLLKDKETHGTLRESGDVSFVSSVPTTGCRSLETSRHMLRDTDDLHVSFEPCYVLSDLGISGLLQNRTFNARAYEDTP